MMFHYHPQLYNFSAYGAIVSNWKVNVIELLKDR